jgi:2',3'-cyclic-nucleotide 2'-phosphodiesterase (5'-nucleotidase family)
VTNAKGKSKGGYPALVARLRAERDKAAASGAGVLLLDAGDIFFGSPEGDMTDGKLVQKLWGLVGYDAVVVGNHDFDKGVAPLRAVVKKCSFPVLGANVLDEKTKQRVDWLKASVRLKVADLDVCVIGVTTDRLAKGLAPPGATDGIEVEAEVDTLKREIDANGDAQVFIALTHCGDEQDEQIAKQIPKRLAAIVGGHTHTPLLKPHRQPDEEGPIVVRAQAKGASFGRVDLEIDRTTGKVLKAEGKIFNIVAADEDAEDIAKELDKGAEEVAELVDQKVGELTAPLKREVQGSSALGNFLCDLVRDHTSADVAILNKTSIRADLPQGEVLYRHLYEVSPFETPPIAMTLTGDELRAILERSLGPEKTDFDVSGVVVRYDSSQKTGERIKSVEVNGKALDGATDYRVVTNTFLANGGDGYKLFVGGREQKEYKTSLIDLQKRRFKKDGKIEPPELERRLQDVAK